MLLKVLQDTDDTPLVLVKEMGQARRRLHAVGWRERGGEGSAGVTVGQGSPGHAEPQQEARRRRQRR